MIERKIVYSYKGYDNTPFCNTFTMHFHRDNDSIAKIEAALA